MDLVVVQPEGLYCPQGDFYIDPWRPVARAVITHAHGDHARPGHAHYLAAQASERVLKARLGEITLQTLSYGDSVVQNDVTVSLHPAGHVLGSAQVRLEHRGEVWVISGDYKLEAEATCAPFEPLRCHTFVSESTFGLPIYRWRPQAEILLDIAAWWRRNAQAQRASVLFCYAFGKAQRILAGLRAADALDIGKLICHGAIEPLNRAYRESGVDLPPTHNVGDVRLDAAARRAASPFARPRLRAVRPRRLAWPQRRDRGNRRIARHHHARPDRGDGALAAAAGLRCACLCHRIRR
jgi:putative mRNA 3-end processing factor